MAPETPPQPTHGPKRYRSPGRRELRAELRARYRLITIDENSMARRVKMGSRAERRKPIKLPNGKVIKRTGAGFRPVYGHAIEVDPPHKYMLMAMRPINREQKQRWFQKLMAEAFVAFGQAVADRE